MTGTFAVPLHPDCEALAFLIGRWKGEGRGAYPTIDDFSYREDVTIGHVGKPFLSYGQRTWRVPGEQPLHSEAGFFRPAGAGRIELVLAQPAGIVEVQEGTVEGGHIELASRVVATTSSAKSVSEVRRTLDVDGDAMRYRLDMAAVGESVRFHLEAELHRAH
jgi:hypothetical protein